MARLMMACGIVLGLLGLSATALAQEAPAAPTDLALDGTTLSWTDNSDDEDGFRIFVELTEEAVGGATSEHEYEVDADVESFGLPEEATDLRCGPNQVNATYEVVAFNDAGESLPSASLGLACPIADGPVVLPTTGGGSGTGGALPAPWLAFVGAALCGLGLVLRLRRVT